ncbi:class I SAM-dependent methyltransferase family protein [uncultured Methanobacterium sp.]|uniref:class I SAM-dependent methyltransferase n=1 Tax=uncultured Methanobacterium sp. TaxID=176306 RepID=UPI002AA8902F|nr:class I SAM-dependent methyltransferase family protein [uncultured Methanobacterium sp.]
MIGLKVPKKEANHIRLFLQEKYLLDHNWKIKRSDDYVYLPLTTKPDNDFIKEMGLFQDNLVETEFEELKKRPRNMEDFLQEKIPPEKMEEFKKSFDIIGDVVILEIPEDLEEEKYLIGEAALKFTKRRSVYRKKSAIKGVIRTRELEHLAGKDDSETIHREYDSRIMLDVKDVYFSPRLATERRIIGDEVQDGEVIIDMFTGVGPFAINIARRPKLKSITIYAVDINPAAIHYLKENMELNKVQGKVKPLLGDVAKVLKDLDVQADRIIMNLPGTACEFLPVAVEHLKPGGTLNYYQFSRDFEDPVERVKKAAYPRQVEVLGMRKVKSRSPKVWHVAIDARIN